MLKYLVVLLCCIWLSGCVQPPVESAIEEYTARLSRVLAQDFNAKSINMPRPPFPERSQDRFSIPQINIELSEFYALNECPLATLIAQRNTVTGKTQLPSQRYAYETQVLQALDTCNTQLATQSELGEKLANWRAQKQQALPIVWAQMFHHSTEIRASLSSLNAPLTEQTFAGGESSIQALNFLIGLASNQNKAIESATIETHLNALNQSHLAAAVWQTRDYLTTNLNALNEQLPAALSEVECPAGIASQQAEYARNVMVLFFIQRIQPIAAQVNAYHHKLSAALTPILDTELLYPPLREYLAYQLGQAQTKFIIANQKHVQIWQSMLSRCNITPISIN